MHISNLGFHIRQPKISEAGSDVLNEGRPEAKDVLAQSNSATKTVSVTDPKVSPIAGKNFLSRDFEIRGSITLTEELIIDGRVDGEIHSAGAVTIGEHAEIIGKIKANSAKIFGRIEGNITANDYCELKSQSVLEGDLRASRLVMEEGASFIGKSEIIPSRVVVKLPQLVTTVERNEADRPLDA